MCIALIGYSIGTLTIKYIRKTPRYLVQFNYHKKTTNSEVLITMITNNGLNNQLPNSLQAVFDELKILKHLRNAGITKSSGFSCGYLFQLIFCLIFEGKHWFIILEGKKPIGQPGKDAIYRFLNSPTYNQCRFLLYLSASTISKVIALTNHQRPKVLIIDESVYERNRSKELELLARCF